MADKLFKDPVHGYIPVDDDICRDYIDKPLFQRLRQIEQTSMRPVYPGARHDRFVHSLGVYFLGCRAIESIFRNSDDLIPEGEHERLRHTFRIACLMHDCGHSPFSHTYEHFYNHSADDEKRANDYLLSLVSADFKSDFGGLDAPPGDHEVFSAALLIDLYKENEDDVELAARMITGIKYENPNGDIQKIENALIELLNGGAIDVDKLDYILRDTWASGIKNTSVDVERLLNSVKLKNDQGNIRLCFKKSALSVLQSVVDARNYLYEWVYTHHTVAYFTELMDRLLKALARTFACEDNSDVFWETVFSKGPFYESVEIGDSGIKVYLPCDGDIMYLLKTRLDDTQQQVLEEVLSHQPKKLALWKTYAEFRFMEKEKNLTERMLSNARNNAAARLAACAGEGYSADDFMIIKVSAKLTGITAADLMIDMGHDRLVSYTDLFGEQTGKSRRFFYVFVPSALKDRRQELIDAIFSC